MKIRAHLEDDEDMGNMHADMQQGAGNSKQGFKKNFIRRNGSPIPRHHLKGGAHSGSFGTQRKLTVGPGGWFQVIVSSCNKSAYNLIIIISSFICSYLSVQSLTRLLS